GPPAADEVAARGGAGDREEADGLVVALDPAIALGAQEPGDAAVDDAIEAVGVEGTARAVDESDDALLGPRDRVDALGERGLREAGGRAAELAEDPRRGLLDRVRGPGVAVRALEALEPARAGEGRLDIEFAGAKDGLLVQLAAL